MIASPWIDKVSRVDLLKSAGLYVMPDRLFLVRIRKDFFRLSIVGAEAREIRGEDAASRRQALSDGIRSLLPYFDPRRDPLYLCLSPDQAIAVQFFLPRAAEENLAQAVGYEIERQIPYRREEVYYGFLPTGRTVDKVRVFLFATPKRNLDEILDVLDAFGIKPKGVETTATALANFLLCCAGGIAGRAVILGSQDRICEFIGLNPGTNGGRADAEILFVHWLPRAEWALGTGREIVRSALREAPKIFGGESLEELLPSDDGEGLPRRDLLDLGKERLAGRKKVADYGFLPAVGAALGGLREGTFAVSLLPGSDRKGANRVFTRLNLWLSLLLLVGLVVWGGSYSIKDEVRLRQLERENRRLGPPVAALRLQEEELNGLRKDLALFDDLQRRRGDILAVLDELSRVVPGDTYLSGLRYHDGTVELRGSADNATSLVPVLEQSPYLKNVGFNAPSNRGRDNRETFSLKAEIERPAEKASKP